jgi:Mor family transcriptional regulator
LDAYVLYEDATPEDEKFVLVEENFSPSLKIEWPDYVKAETIRNESENGMNDAEIAKKYNWPRTKVKETLRICEIMDDFLQFASDDRDPEDENGGGLGLSEVESVKIAAQNYQFFNEAQKSFYDELRRDYDFKANFFKWIYEKKFSSFPEVRIAYKAWKDPDAKSILVMNEPTAAKEAKTILDDKNRVLKSVEGAQEKVHSFVRFLKGLTVEELQKFPEKTKLELKDALELLAKMY